MGVCPAVRGSFPESIVLELIKNNHLRFALLSHSRSVTDVPGLPTRRLHAFRAHQFSSLVRFLMALRFLKYLKPRSLPKDGQLGATAAICPKIVESAPDHWESVNELASIALQSGQTERAIELCSQFIALKPDLPTAYYKRADALNRLGRLELALGDYDQAVALDPQYASALCSRGSVLRKLGKLDDALASYDRAIEIDNNYAEAYFYRGIVLHELRLFEAAAASHEKAIEFTPVGLLPYMAYTGRGHALLQLKRLEQAIESYNHAIAGKVDHSEAYLGLGLALRHAGRLDEALSNCNQAVALSEGRMEAYANRGGVLLDMGRYELALSDFDKAIELDGMRAQLFQSRGRALRCLKRLNEALASFDEAIAIGGGADVYIDQANVLLEIGRFGAALESYAKASELSPNDAEALQGCGFALMNMSRLEAAIVSFDEALQANPEQQYLPGLRQHLKMRIFDWKDLETTLEVLSAQLRAGKSVSTPFPMLALVDSAPIHRLAAKLWADHQYPENDILGAIPQKLRRSKIHIAYFSPDLRNHPVSLLAAELFETHDRSRFEVTAISFGPKCNDQMRKRLERAFDQFLEVEEQSDLQVAALARNLGVDIAVDLAGFTEHCRTQIFAMRAAPVQISYLGYLGTMAAPYMDYLIADTVIIPKSEQQHYCEKIIYLPSYQANDSKRRASQRVFTRQELGLPREGFVFACFNATYKLTPQTFELWMSILNQVRDSSLFLCVDDEVAKRNIQLEAGRRGLDSRRIVFGEKLPFDEYLARCSTVDLFLDTLPYNAGTTASDALWAGLPVVTCIGKAFAGRVAASLLTAINLPELIADTPAAYVALAVNLATDRSRMAQIRTKLKINRLSTRLFDTAKFTRNLEAAYMTVVERYYAGLPPEHVHVER